MLKLRVLTVAVILPLFLAAMFLLSNGWWSALLIAPLVIGGVEWSKLAQFGRPATLAFIVAIVTGCALLWAASIAVQRAVLIMSFVFWCGVGFVWLRLKLAIRNRAALAFAGLIVLLPMWLALSQLQIHPLLLLCLLAIVWISDTAAFFAGRALGRRKLAPAISPGKSWEGVAGAFAAVTVYALTLHFSLFSAYSLAMTLVGFFGITCLGIIGDLFESWIKRNAGVKDSGKILPGHGGVLDRIDALTAAMPLAALIFHLQ